MRFTDLFIRRPVLASVVSLIILLLGLNALKTLQVRQYPQLENAVINISTAYPGASSELVSGFITSPIQQAVASAEGIDYLTSSSNQGSSLVEVHLKLGFDSSTAMTEILSKVAEARRQLPADAEEPVIQKSTAGTTALMYVSFFSQDMSEAQITDYLKRVVQPQLETADGVAKAEILGGKTFAMRVWLNPQKLAAFDLTPQDVARAVGSNSFLSAAGATKGQYITANITADTDLHSVQEFQQLVVKRDDATLVRLQDVATIELDAESDDSAVYFNGNRAVFMAITSLPAANPLEVIDNIYDLMPALEKQLPSALNVKVAYDATKFIRDSINEVIKTVGEATVIVIFVIFLFLGSLRAVMIPVVTIPLSLVGVCFFMLALGYSINLLTLLAMVLAIGLVVDDAIVVVENIHRHIDEGLSPFKAAIIGAREIATPVISMTLTLAAVYAPIGFLGGLTGGLFKEFAFALAGAVIISGVIALTLSPMMCSKLMTETNSKMAIWLDEVFEKLRGAYQRRLHNALNYRPVTLVMVLTMLVSCFYLYQLSNKELARDEDQGIIFSMSTAPVSATHDYVAAYTDEVIKTIETFDERNDYFIVQGADGAANSMFSGMILKTWGERERSQMELVPIMQQRMGDIAGYQSVSFNLPTLPGSSGLPVQFVITTAQDYKVLYELGQELLAEARKSGKFLFVNSDLKFDKPTAHIAINRSKAAELGISMQDIGAALATMLSGGYTTRFSVEGRSYKVIPQVLREYRATAEQLDDYYVRTASGELIPLSTIAEVSKGVEPNKRGQFQQLNSMVVEGVMTPGISLGEALDFLDQKAQTIFPQGYGYEYAGQSRQYKQEGSALIFTFFFALLMIYLVLAAQFESFRDPFIILVSVPMSLLGALIPIAFGVTSVNIYTQIGLVTLIGLITKHGILIVEFANQLQVEQGLSKREAIEQAAGIRLRAILMTTAAMVVGVLPLLFASGAGAVSRFDIGLVIASGLSIGTIFTLFVVPTMYMILGTDHSQVEKQEDVDGELSHA
ncbi:efflux RND transporter permease subunit [Hahella aquimaris]|uniref:efflux RND transporter permease subunit n=1 Tax=Hahella sp. HNIBRBA332 TaxID=3015983 RepID=UPI00273AB49A|nr:efflux RND transporter permease subunit [Hahella sp. HNIBRBA332]WLQ11237.1 efflux RND transporter permease subunit [Hahella sp. HNIBRBA332]